VTKSTSTNLGSNGPRAANNNTCAINNTSSAPADDDDDDDDDDIVVDDRIGDNTHDKNVKEEASA